MPEKIKRVRKKDVRRNGSGETVRGEREREREGIRIWKIGRERNLKKGKNGNAPSTLSSSAVPS